MNLTFLVRAEVLLLHAESAWEAGGRGEILLAKKLHQGDEGRQNPLTVM